MKTIKDLRHAYYKALEGKQETFTIEEYDFFIPYAKYLLEYLDNLNVPEDTMLRTILIKQEHKKYE